MIEYYGIGVLVLRLVTLIVGFFVIKLGYNLLLKGISGGFKFSSQYKGIKGGLISSSPGLLFVLLGSIICISALYIDRPFKYNPKTGETVLNSKAIPTTHLNTYIKHLKVSITDDNGRKRDTAWQDSDFYNNDTIAYMISLTDSIYDQRHKNWGYIRNSQIVSYKITDSAGIDLSKKLPITLKDTLLNIALKRNRDEKDVSIK